MNRLIDAVFRCAYCGEEIETSIDPTGGNEQLYTEDCAVCCRPNLLSIIIEEGTLIALSASPES